MDGRTLLLVTVAMLTVYTIGIGGTTAAAIGARDSWRRHERGPTNLDPLAGEVVLAAPTLRRLLRALRVVGWIAFVPALVLALFANSSYPWLAPFTVVLMVGLNAFYFTAMQGIGEHLVLTTDGFRAGPVGSERTVRWVHITDLMGAHIGPFRGVRMSEGAEWQDPKTVPNVIFYRLNRALVRPRKSPLSRLTGMTYFDGVIRNRYGVSTQQLMQAMRTCHRRAMDEESRRLRGPRVADAQQPLTNPER